MRIPRKQGYTTLPKEELKQRLIEDYSNENFTIDNTPVTIKQLANYVDLPIRTVIVKVNEHLERIGKFFDDKDSIRAIARVGFQSQFLGIQETIRIAQSQTNILLASQGQSYVPFLSSAVNQSIANQISSFKPMTELVKLLIQDSSAPNAVFNFNTMQLTNNNIVTPDMALQMIEDKSQFIQALPSGETNLGTHDMLQELPEKGTIEKEFGTMPEVNAKFQDLTSIGIRNTPQSDT